MPRIYTRLPLMERFNSHVDRTGSCWEWTAATGNHGYGVFNIGKRVIKTAHRLAWELENGPIPEGQFVCHKCDNRKCVRLDHLFLGTQADNIHDAMAKGRHVPPPVMLGADNPRSKLYSPA